MVPVYGEQAYLPVRAYYTPSLPVTILSPSDMADRNHCEGYKSLSLLRSKIAKMTLVHCGTH